MMRPCPYPPEELLPHGSPMVLLDEVLGWDEQGVEAALTIRRTDRFFEPGLGVPSYLGIEWMAQTCGLYAGLEARAAGQEVRLGFLLGTRRYRAAKAWFAQGERLRVTAALVFREDGMGVFDCRILGQDDEELAAAQLTTFQPEDPSAVLSNQSTE